jgi:hypothetical protein
MENEKLQNAIQEIHELKEGRKQVFEKLDQKADKVDLERIIDTLKENSRENRSYLWKAFFGGVGGVVAVCGFFWNRTEMLSTKIEAYNTNVFEFKLKITEDMSSLRNRLELLEEKLRSLQLIK